MIKIEKTIKISEEAHIMLMNCGNKGDTFDEIIKKLVGNYDATNNRK